MAATGAAGAYAGTRVEINFTHRKIRKDSAGRMRRKMKRMARLYHEGKMTWDQVHQVIMSWIGHAGHANTYKLRTRVLCDVPFIPPPLEVQRRAK